MLNDRVAVITGAGRGLGRAHALSFARLGARVVVNDLGVTGDGTEHEVNAAEVVVKEIEALGGEAVANTDDVADWQGAKCLVDTAIEAFGTLDVLVNNAGILRDGFLTNLTEEAFDGVVRVHLKGHVAALHWAARYWRDSAKAGTPVATPRVVNTSSGSGLYGNPGQVNYAAAKAGIVAATLVAARELERFGVKVNVVAPAARTRLTLATPGISDLMAAPDDEDAFDVFDPANISPLVAFLASPACEFSGHVFGAFGGNIVHYEGWTQAGKVAAGKRWEPDQLVDALAGWETAIPPFPQR